MADEKVGEYLPDDPRYGKNAEELRQYYSQKPAQWVIFAWDRPDRSGVRSEYIEAQKQYARDLGEQLIGYGHIVTENASAMLATTWFVQLDDHAAAEAFVADDPLNRAGVYERIEIKRWSNSFLKRACDYDRKGQEYYFYTGSKIEDAGPFIAEHLHAHESYFKSFEDSFIFRGPLRSPDGMVNVGTALLIELPDRIAAESFWNNEPFAAHGGYQDDSRMYRWVFGDE
jgi:uncharacterized protein YciI